jgi:type II secretory pathway component PulM
MRQKKEHSELGAKLFFSLVHYWTGTLEEDEKMVVTGSSLVLVYFLWQLWDPPDKNKQEPHD